MTARNPANSVANLYKHGDDPRPGGMRPDYPTEMDTEMVSEPTKSAFPDFTATDWRRGTSLLLNYCDGNAAGVWSVAADCDGEADAVWSAVLAALAFVVELNPALRTPEGVAALRAAVLAYAAAESDAKDTDDDQP